MNKAIPLAIAGALFVILIIILVVVLSRGGDSAVQARSAASKPAVAPKPTVASTPASAPTGTTSAGTTTTAAKPAAAAPAPVDTHKAKKAIAAGCTPCKTTGIYACKKDVIKSAEWYNNQAALVSDYRMPEYDPVDPNLDVSSDKLYWRMLGDCSAVDK